MFDSYGKFLRDLQTIGVDLGPALTAAKEKAKKLQTEAGGFDAQAGEKEAEATRLLTAAEGLRRKADNTRATAKHVTDAVARLSKSKK